MTATEQKWAERVQAWRESGLTAREFSRGRGFSAGSVWYWTCRLKKLKTIGSTTSAAPATTVKEKVAKVVRVARVERIAAPKNTTLTIEIGPVRMHVPERVDVATLRATVAVLVEATARGGGR